MRQLAPRLAHNLQRINISYYYFISSGYFLITYYFLLNLTPVDFLLEFLHVKEIQIGVRIEKSIPREPGLRMSY